MNWIRYQGSTSRSSRRDREQWVREKLQEAIALKQEQIRLGTRPKLTRTSIDPKESYFLRRLIHLDKATGGVTWKLFEVSPSLHSDVSSSSPQTSRRRPNSTDSGNSSRTPHRAIKRRPLPTLTDSTGYSRSTQSLAQELQYTAAEERRWVTRMMEVTHSEEESSESDTSGSETSTVSSSSEYREESRPRRARAVAKKSSTPRKSFSAKEIFAMLPTDSPNLNAATRPHRKRITRKRRNRERTASVDNRPLVDSRDEPPRKVHFKKARRESTDTSEQDLESESSDTSQGVLVSETLETSSSQRSQTMSKVNRSASSSVSETISSALGSETSTEAPKSTFSSSSEMAVSKTDASSNQKIKGTPVVGSVGAGNSRNAETASSPISADILCGGVASVTSRGVWPPVPFMKPQSIDLRIPLLSQFDVTREVDTNQRLSPTLNVAEGARTSYRESVASGLQAVAVARGSFASRTLIMSERDQSGRERRGSTFASTVRCGSRLQAQKRVETDQDGITPSTEVALKRTPGESRSASVSGDPIPRGRNSAGSAAPFARPPVSNSRLDVSKQVDSREKTSTSAVTAVSAKEPRIEAQEARSGRSVATGLKNRAPWSRNTDSINSPASVATTVLFNNRLNSEISAYAIRQGLRNASNISVVSRKSESTLFSDSGHSLNSFRSSRNDSRKKKRNSRKKQGVITSPDLSYLPGLFLSSKTQRSFSTVNNEGAYLGSPPTSGGTQTFTSSIAEE